MNLFGQAGKKKGSQSPHFFRIFLQSGGFFSHRSGKAGNAQGVFGAGTQSVLLPAPTDQRKQGLSLQHLLGDQQSAASFWTVHFMGGDGQKIRSGGFGGKGNLQKGLHPSVWQRTLGFF